MSRRDRALAALRSYGRVLGTCLATAYLGLGKASPLDLTVDDLRPFAAAVLSALVLTAVNWLRTGDSRFGPAAPAPEPPAVVEPQPVPQVAPLEPAWVSPDVDANLVDQPEPDEPDADPDRT